MGDVSDCNGTVIFLKVSCGLLRLRDLNYKTNKNNLCTMCGIKAKSILFRN